MIDNDIDDVIDAVKDLINKDILMGVGFIFELTDDYSGLVLKRLDNYTTKIFSKDIPINDLKRDWLLATKIGLIKMSNGKEI